MNYFPESKDFGSTLPKGGAGKLKHRVELWNMGPVEKQVPGMAAGITATAKGTGTNIGNAWMSLKALKSKTAEDVRAGVEENIQFYEFVIRYRLAVNTNYEFRESSTSRVFNLKQIYDGTDNKGHSSGIVEERRA